MTLKLTWTQDMETAFHIPDYKPPYPLPFAGLRQSINYVLEGHDGIYPTADVLQILERLKYLTADCHNELLAK